jgi:hypothetical protein
LIDFRARLGEHAKCASESRRANAAYVSAGSISLGVWAAADHGRRPLAIQKPGDRRSFISVDLMRPVAAWVSPDVANIGG